ncbi:MAG: M3 family oligoendopeptidase [Elusimicrobia bacterium]|nr:M3 family oligoendopeptidase [Elusimicrobiota bacterium]
MTKLVWDLEDLFPFDDFEKEYSEIEKQIGLTDCHFKEMNPDMSLEVFKNFLLFSEEISARILHLYYRAALEETADISSDNFRMLKNRVLDLDKNFSEKSRKIWHWIRGKEVSGKVLLDEKNANRLFGVLPALKDYLFHLRKTAPHILSDREEMILAEKDLSGISPLLELRNIIETGFEFEFKPSGQKARKIRTQAELLSYTHSSVRSEREAAYNALLEKYRDNISKFFTAYRGAVRDWSFEASLRNYTSSLDMRNSMNRIPGEAVKSLLEACRGNRFIYQEYFKIKASDLKIKNFQRHDIYAPVGEKVNEIPLDEGLELVLDVFKSFSPSFYKAAKEIVDMKHIDSEPQQNKQGGAFCASPGAGKAPYILLNYTGQPRDVLTLAHELGHGIHSLLAGNLPLSVMQAGLPLAETASTFSEMLVFEQLLKRTKSKEGRKSLYFQKMQDSFATVLRQAYFVLFEIEAHEALKKGLTPDGLSEIYYKLLVEEFGEGVKINEIFKYEWAYIPHIVNSPFYCYSYAFGELLSLALLAEYKREKQGFVPVMEEILSVGGSEDPVEILKSHSFDITKKDFWDKGFREIEQLFEGLKETLH